MNIICRNRSALWLISLASLLLAAGNCAVSLADEGDVRLRKRITALEAENRSLRRIITAIQSSLASVPPSTIVSTKRQGLRILVAPGEWGGSELADIKKVCESAAGTITAQLTDDGFAPILVQRGNSGPITLYERGAGNEHIIRLDTGSNAWAQCAFQFAHELCHVVCNYRDAGNRQKWFEETLCECASLYALRRMAVEWETNPPYSNWKSYSASLATYANDRITKYSSRKKTVAQFYTANSAELEKTATNRELNTYLAVKLLPHFEKNPTAWQALRYLNLGPASENTSFRTYLTCWHARVPKEHQPFIRGISAEFGVRLSVPARAD